MLNKSRVRRLGAGLMLLMLLDLSSMGCYADSANYRHLIEISGKSLALKDQRIRYAGVDFRLFRFGFISFDVAVRGSSDNVQQKARLSPNGPILLQTYYGLKPVFLFAMERVNLSLSYLFGEGLGYYVEASGDVYGECGCSYALTEAALALSFNLNPQWEIGVEKSQLKIESVHAPDKWDGQSVFLRYAW